MKQRMTLEKRTGFTKVDTLRDTTMQLRNTQRLSGAMTANGGTQKRVSARLQTMYRMIGSVQKEKNENDRR